MRHGRMALGVLVIGAALVVAGCGGGGGGTAGAGSGQALGSVISLDDSTANLGGVEVTDVRTGETCRTDARGDFDLGSVPAGTLTLCIGRDGPPTDVAEVGEGETVRLNLRVRRGEIEGSDARNDRREHRRAGFRLVRSEESDDEDVVGEGGIESSPMGDAIGVVAVHLDAGREVEWFVISPDGIEESQGVEAADERGVAHWKRGGDRLPFGAESVERLEGFGVEIRDASAGTLLLFGTIPALPLPPEPPAPPPEWHDLFGVALLPRGEGVVGEAHVEVASRTGREPREVIAIGVVGQRSGAAFTVWVTHPERADEFALVGDFAVSEEGRGAFVRNTMHGDRLPFGVASVLRLVGLGIEVRDESGAVAYAGRVPELHEKR